MIQKSKRLDRVVRVFDPYQDRREYVRLDRNEDPVGWDEEHFEAIRNSLTPYDLAAYADSNRLVHKLATWTGLSALQIYITAGSDQAIKNIFEAYIDEGDKVLMQKPSWRMYDVYNDVYKGAPVFAQYDQNFRLDTDWICKKIDEDKIRMVIIANPNQPIGGVLAKKEIEKIIKTAQNRNTLAVVDEAYYLFTQETCVDLLGRYDNLIVVRTFSKAFGLASLRMGYILANEVIIKDLMLLRPVTDANGLALKIGEYALDHLDWIKDRVQSFIAGREFLYQQCRSADLKVLESHTNFVHILYPTLEKAQEILQKCKEEGYLLKIFNFAPLHNSIRISIGDKKLMEKFWLDCASILKS